MNWQPVEAAAVAWQRLVCGLCSTDSEQAEVKSVFTKKNGWKVAHGPRKNRLDFVGNPGHAALGLGWD